MSKLIILILTYAFNMVDLALTMYLSKNSADFVELNPFGQILIDSGMLAPYKTIVIGVLLVVLWYFKENKIANIGIYICFGVYALLMIYWIVYLLTK